MVELRIATMLPPRDGFVIETRRKRGETEGVGKGLSFREEKRVKMQVLGGVWVGNRWMRQVVGSIRRLVEGSLMEIGGGR